MARDKQTEERKGETEQERKHGLSEKEDLLAKAPGPFLICSFVWGCMGGVTWDNTHTVPEDCVLLR